MNGNSVPGIHLANRLRRALAGLAAIALLVAIWAAGVAILRPPAYLVPSPARVTQALVSNAAYFADHALVTLGEMLLGLGAGGACGVCIALIVARYPSARPFVMPAIVTTQTLPVFAIAPLLVIWFGFGAGSKVVMAALIIFFPVASMFHDGLAATNRSFLDLARNWGASANQTLWKIRVPAALPHLASGLKVAATLAPIGAIVGEWAGASGGLGYVMLQANARGQTDRVFACIVILAVIALLLRASVSFLCSRLIFWQAA